MNFAHTFRIKISIRVNVIETKIKNSFVVRMNGDRVVNEMWHIYTARTRQSNNHTYSVDQRSSSVQNVVQLPESWSTLMMISKVAILIKYVG